ncbi:MAG: DUF1822 family protein [Pseudanabaenaceae cyanobacterium]
MTVQFYSTLLEIPPQLKAQALREYRKYPRPQEGWQYLLNYLVAKTVVNWLREELGGKPSISDTPTWQFVNGVKISLEGINLVVLPDESIDRASLVIPREWVEHPDWVGDYFFAATVDIDREMVELWGFCDYSAIKQATIDYQDQNYILDRSKLSCDLNLWLSYRQFNIPLAPKVVNSVPQLASTRVNNLTDRLALTSIISPRLAIPFSDWLSLLHERRALERLGLLRQGQRVKSVTNLRDWWAGIFSSEWQEPALSYGYALRGEEEKITRLRQMMFTTEGETVQLYILVSLTKKSQQEVGVLFQLLAPPDQRLPILEVAIRDAEGNTVITTATQGNESLLKLRSFSCTSGDQFSLVLQYKNETITEEFTI